MKTYVIMKNKEGKKLKREREKKKKNKEILKQLLNP